MAVCLVAVNHLPLYKAGMIKYALKCSNGHSFESWFQSATAFDKLQSAHHLNCPHCGDSDIAKALMSPKLSQGSEAPVEKAVPPTADPEPAELMKQMKDAIEARSDYVGDRFAEEARAIHLDEAPARPIHGEANAKEARALVEEGVPILPLPFRPSRKNN